jgi:glutamate 5-kinase
VIPEILSATQATQSLFTLLKAANKLANYNELVAAVAEVSGKLMAAHQAGAALQEKNSLLAEEVGALKEEIASLKTFELEKERYSLAEIGTGVYAYVLKESAANGDPPHWLCVNCYSQGKKSILHSKQTITRSGAAVTHICPRRECGAEYEDQQLSIPQREYAK